MIARVGLRALLLFTLVALTRGTAASAAEPPDADAYGTFLDSLRTRSDSALDRSGVEPTWPAADSLADLIMVHGPAYVDSIPTAKRRHAVDFDFNPALTAYNRVDGMRAGGELGIGIGPLSLSGAAAYGFSSDEWRHRERARLETSRGTFTFEHADLLERFGAGPVPANSIHAFIAGADDQDYLERRRTGGEWRLGDDPRSVAVAYTVADERSAVAETDWNLFSRDRGPRPNPPIDEGRARRLLFTGSTQVSPRPLRGARLRFGAEAEVAGYGLGGDFDYDRYRLTLDSRWPVLWRDNADLRLEIGGARNGPPIQSLFYLGGPAAMRAYGVNELRGDRYFFSGLDYLVGTDPFAHLHLPQVQIQFIPFFELGAAWQDENGRGVWSSPDSHDWKADAGLGLQRLFMFETTIRLDLAWRLDRGSDQFLYRFGFRTPLFGLED